MIDDLADNPNYVPCPHCVGASDYIGDCPRCEGVGFVHVDDLNPDEAEVWFGPQL